MTMQLKQLETRIMNTIAELEKYQDQENQSSCERAFAEGRILQARQTIRWIVEISME
jgi:hypothetical protein